METQTAHSSIDKSENDRMERKEATLGESIKKYVNGMYEEYKKCFELKNFERIEKIIKNITNVDPGSNILNIIEGSLSLYRGEGSSAYKLLFEFTKNSDSIDLWALNFIAMWNMITGQHKEALGQFAQILQGPFGSRFLIGVMICTAKTKKMLGFFDKSLEYFKRLLRIPEGFKMILLIKLEIIHIYILKKQYETALYEIEKYLKDSDNFFIRRLKIYIYYLKKNYKEILKFKREDEKDPYILYILARVGLENPEYSNIDVSFCLDEAIKNAKENKYIYNTYGNFYYSKNRFSDAAEQYNNALLLDPFFEPALSNLKLFVKAGSKSDQHIYFTKADKISNETLSDVNPDVEKLGFLDTWKLLGYSTFRMDYLFLRKYPSLKYYFPVN